MRKKIDLGKLTVAVSLASAVCLLPQFLQAKASGPCSDCHTMHNSQDGTAEVSGGPYRALAKGDCIGCHTGDNTEGGNIPYVLASSSLSYANDGSTQMLAGGNFKWMVDGNDTKGHNVIGLGAGNDTNIDGTGVATPPGWNNSDFPDTGGDVVAGGEATWSSQLTCAGTYGCHGSHGPADDFAAISGAHHADDSSINGTTVGKSYRFLLGIKGVEDDDWENSVSDTDHNQYYGIDRTDDDPTSMDKATISYLCAQCHGNFHSGTGDAGADTDNTAAAPWLRHPTDFDMGSATGSEYGAYPGDGSGSYSTTAPVASTDLSAVQSTVLDEADDAIVTCISCHRAHGSDHADLLRWDYGTCDAGSDSTCGCFDCHTTKDAG